MLLRLIKKILKYTILEVNRTLNNLGHSFEKLKRFHDAINDYMTAIQISFISDITLAFTKRRNILKWLLDDA